MERGRAGRGTDAPPCVVPVRASPSCSDGGTTQTLSPGRMGSKAMGATRKGLNPSQRCGEQAGASWG